MAQAMYIIDSNRSIILRNAEGIALLAHGEFVLEREGRLDCRGPGSNDAFLAALRGLAIPGAPPSPAMQRAITLRGSTGRPAIARVLALQPSRGEDRSLFMVTIVEPSPLEVDPRVIAETYALTPAESRLVALIAEGRSTSQCSNELGVKTSTLRSHLKSIYSKTYAAGKADLVRMVLTACAT